MAIIGNYTVVNKNPVKFVTGGTASAEFFNRGNYNFGGRNRNFYCGQASISGLTATAGVPNGYLHPYSWILPQKAGGISSYTLLTSEGSITYSNLAGGINILSATNGLTGLMYLTPVDGQLIVSTTANLTGLGSLNTPVILGIITGTASITGLGSLNLPGLGAIVSAASNITGYGNLTTTDLTNASLLAIASLTGGILVTTGDLRAKGNIEANILPYTELSPESLAAAVWEADSSIFNDAGTYGKLVKQIKAMISAGL
jgi:hypothetical protein